MNEVQPRGFLKCIFTCIGMCEPGCFACFGDGPVFAADTATGGVALMSGMGTGANS